MGIFNINMPTLYGEGAESAFQRLQKEITETSFDQGILPAWRVKDHNRKSNGLLADSPVDFTNTPPLGLLVPVNQPDTLFHDHCWPFDTHESYRQVSKH